MFLAEAKHKSFLEENAIILSLKESWKFLTSMNRTQLNTTKHTKENGNMSKNQQKYHTAEANKQWLQMVVLSDTDYKILVLFKENMEEIIVNWIRRIISCDLSLWYMLDNVFRSIFQLTNSVFHYISSDVKPNPLINLVHFIFHFISKNFIWFFEKLSRFPDYW